MCHMQYQFVGRDPLLNLLVLSCLSVQRQAHTHTHKTDKMALFVVYTDYYYTY